MQKLKKISIILLLSVFIIIFSVACSPKSDDNVEEKNNISYIQNTFYHGKTSNFEVKICSGKSEVLFIADGKTNECKEFCTLTVIPSGVDLFNCDYSFTIIGENGETKGTLTKDSFGAYYLSDVEIKNLGKITNVHLSYNSKTEEVPMTDMLEGKVDGMKALEVIKGALADKLKANDKEREIYIRMINNTNKPESEYYWYVAFIATPTDYYSGLVNPADGSIISIT